MKAEKQLSTILSKVIPPQRQKTSTPLFVDNRIKLKQQQLLDGINQSNTIQRYINMHGTIYYKKNDFCEQFAKYLKLQPWELPNLHADYIDKIFDKHYSFASYQAIINQIIPQGNHLPLNTAYMHPGSQCGIIMQGSRQADYAEAERTSRKTNPEGYIWHHIEGIYTAANGITYCSMVLMETRFHNQPHSGAVAEYEKCFNVKYQ